MKLEYFQLRMTFATALLSLVSLAAGAQQPYPLNKRVPAANYELFREVRDSKQWKNPYLIVLRDGVEVVAVTDKGSPVPVSAIRELLEGLPNSAWPYGRVVAPAERAVRVRVRLGLISTTIDELIDGRQPDAGRECLFDKADGIGHTVLLGYLLPEGEGSVSHAGVAEHILDRVSQFVGRETLSGQSFAACSQPFQFGSQELRRKSIRDTGAVGKMHGIDPSAFPVLERARA